MKVLAVAVIFIVAPLWGYLASRRRLAPLRRRPCSLDEWQSAFPGTSPNYVSEFLKLTADGFGLPAGDEQRLRPSDRVLDLYRMLVPPGHPDSLELEHWAVLLERRYVIDLNAIWRDGLTLGDVMAAAISASR
jgi:hypothetical protein